MTLQIDVTECAICGTSNRFSMVQEQVLDITGIGNITFVFGYCVNCGHIQQTTRASDYALERYYSQFSNYTCFDREAALAEEPQALTRRLMGLVHQHKPKPGTIFEAGCATGKHLHHFKKAGWKVSGCDLSPKAARQAMALYGIDVEDRTAEFALGNRSGLDVVYFSHVLEHVPNPIETLSHAVKAIADDGLIVFEVPCSTEPLTQPPGLFTLEHLHYFGYDDALEMVRKAGLEPIEVRVSIHQELVPVIAVAARKMKAVFGNNRPVCWHESGKDTARRAAVVRTEAFINDYLVHDNRTWARSANALRDVKEPFYIWGAGIHTAQMIFHMPHIKRHLVAMIDRDPQKWGARQGDFRIVSPTDFYTDTSKPKVVISSHVFEDQIARDLKKSGVDESRIVRLYTGSDDVRKDLAA